MPVIMKRSEITSIAFLQTIGHFTLDSVSRFTRLCIVLHHANKWFSSQTGMSYRKYLFVFKVIVSSLYRTAPKAMGNRIFSDSLNTLNCRVIFTPSLKFSTTPSINSAFDYNHIQRIACIYEPKQMFVFVLLAYFGTKKIDNDL